MELQKKIDSLSSPVPRRSSFFFISAVLLLVSMVAGAFYLSFQKTSILAEQLVLDGNISSLNTQINDLKGQKVESEQFAKKYLDELEKNEIRWSEIIKSLQALVPVDSTTQKPKIRFLTYSGSVGGKLTLNAETLPSVLPAYADISELLNVFNTSAFFRDAYVPSISRGVSEAGSVLLSFPFHVIYDEETPVSNLQPALNPLPVLNADSNSENTQQKGTSVQPKVPRK